MLTRVSQCHALVFDCSLFPGPRCIRVDMGEWGQFKGALRRVFVAAVLSFFFISFVATLSSITVVVHNCILLCVQAAYYKEY